MLMVTTIGCQSNSSAVLEEPLNCQEHMSIDGTFLARVDVKRVFADGTETTFAIDNAEIVIDQYGPAIDFFGIVGLLYQDYFILAGAKEQSIYGDGSPPWYSFVASGRGDSEQISVEVTHYIYSLESELINHYSSTWTYSKLTPQDYTTQEFTLSSANLRRAMFDPQFPLWGLAKIRN